MVSGHLPLNSSMILNRKLFSISSFLFFFFIKNLSGQGLFNFDSSRSSVFTQSIASSIGVADINGDGINDIAISGYGYYDNQQGLFLNIYSVSPTGEIDTLQSDVVGDYFAYIPGSHSSRYIGGDGGIDFGDYDRDGKIDILVHGAEFLFLTKNLGSNVSLNNYFPSEVIESLGESSAQWGDVDLDGDLDIFWTGLTNGRANITKQTSIE